MYGFSCYFFLLIQMKQLLLIRRECAMDRKVFTRLPRPHIPLQPFNWRRVHSSQDGELICQWRVKISPLSYFFKEKQTSFDLAWKHLTQLETLSILIVMRQIHKVKAKCVLLMSIFLVHCRSERNTVQCMWQRSSKVVNADRENTEDHEVCKTKEGSRIDPSVVGQKENSGVWKSTIQWYRNGPAFLFCGMTYNQH